MSREFENPKEFYLNENNRIDNALQREGNRRDSLIFAVSMGSIVLSANAVIGMLDNFTILNLNILYLSWFLLITSILIGIINYFISEQDNKTRFEKLRYFKNNGGEYNPKNIWQKIVCYLNMLTASLLFLGILFLLSFFIINISYNNNMKDKEDNNVFDNEKSTKSVPLSAISYSEDVYQDPTEEAENEINLDEDDNK